MRTLIYDFSEIDDRAERMRLVKDKDFDAYFELLDHLTNVRTKVAEDLMSMAYEHGCVMVQPMTGIMRNHRYYISPSLSVDGGLRYTTWDNKGPVGHGEIGDARWLEEYLPSHSFKASYK